MENRDNDLMRQQELENCSFIKTVLMILVVFYHSILFWGGNWFTETPVFEAKPLGYVAQWLTSFHIYAFTLISGYLFYCLKFEKGKYGPFIPFVRNKAKRLLIPYCFTTVLWVIPISCIYYPEFCDWRTLIHKFLLGISPSQLWFLLMLFFVFVIAWCLSSLWKKHDFLSIVITFAFCGVGILGAKVLPNVYQIWTACKYLILFLIGFKIRQHGSALLMKIPSLVWLAADLLFFWLERCIPDTGSPIGQILKLGISFCVNIFGAVMAFVVLQKIASKISYKNNKTIALLTKTSMAVYLFHQQVIYVFLDVLNGLINPYLHAGITFVGAVGVSVLLASLLMKCKATRFLIGEK